MALEKNIKVRCKGNLGFHPDLGQITEGRELTILESQMTEELFELIPEEPAAPAKKTKTE